MNWWKILMKNKLKKILYPLTIIPSNVTSKIHMQNLQSQQCFKNFQRPLVTINKSCSASAINTLLKYIHEMSFSFFFPPKTKSSTVCNVSCLLHCVYTWTTVAHRKVYVYVYVYIHTLAHFQIITSMYLFMCKKVACPWHEGIQGLQR